MHGNETNLRTDLNVHVQQHVYTDTHKYWKRYTCEFDASELELFRWS